MISASVIVLCVLSEHLTRLCVREFVVYSYNTGAAFGLMGGSPVILVAIEITVSLILIAILVFTRIRVLTRIGLSMMLGGALSNLGERLILGRVIDWIPVPFLKLQYNLADVEISLGALIVFLVSNLNDDVNAD